MLESKMHKRLCDSFPTIMFQRIETSTGSGIPDTSYGRNNIVGWMELKQLAKWSKKIVTIPWHDGQLSWYHNYAKVYKNTDRYILCLTIENSWFFIKHDIKEKYTVEELSKYYLCENEKLRYNFAKVLTLL